MEENNTLNSNQTYTFDGYSTPSAVSVESKSRSFKIAKDPYGDGKIFKKPIIEIQEGFTVLVGCNGFGKTTLMRLMREQLKKECPENVCVLEYSDYNDGRGMAKSAAGFYGRLDTLGSLIFSSEGEQLYANVGTFIGQIGRTIHNSQKNEIWIFLDGIDSGASIDTICEMKKFFKEDLPSFEPDKTFYVIASANSYELARDERCIDLMAFKEKRFKTYESYRKYIMRTRTLKDARSKH